VDLALAEDDIALMRTLVDILEPFEDAIKKFEAEKEPTIHHVIPQFLLLKTHVVPKDGDSEVTACLRRRLSAQLEDKFAKSIAMRHKMGAFFWPRFAGMKFLSDEERAEVITGSGCPSK
jgi:hypothetical protein